MDLVTALKQLPQKDTMTILACIHHCAVLPKKERERFQKDYGMASDRHITELMRQLSKR